MQPDWTFIIFLAAAYLIGALPFGLLLGKMKGVDIRDHGSGNIGATNAGRVLGRKLGILCFVLDVFKGLGPTLAYGLVAGVIAEPGDSALVVFKWLGVSAAAIVGHVFPVYLKFKGGKGVATSLGALLGVFPVLTIAALIGGVVWFVTVKKTALVSLASIVAALTLPICATAAALLLQYSIGQWFAYTVVTMLLSLLVVVKHRTNISRLRDGTEVKVDWVKSKKSRETE